jgi:hypothetical protein
VDLPVETNELKRQIPEFYQENLYSLLYLNDALNKAKNFSIQALYCFNEKTQRLAESPSILTRPFVSYQNLLTEVMSPHAVPRGFYCFTGN